MGEPWELSLLRMIGRSGALFVRRFPAVAFTSIPVLAPLVWLMLTTFADLDPGRSPPQMAVVVFALVLTQIVLSALLSPVARASRRPP